MTRAAYTPGPWHADLIPLDEALDNGDDPLFVYVGEDANDTRVDVCTVHGWPTRTGQREANARLIAAAPDLLNAAIQAEDLLRELEEGGANNPELQMLRAAIAKATGAA